jgi:hypothetical protein
MGVPTYEISYTSATTGRGDDEVHKGHVVALGKKNYHSQIKNKLLSRNKFSMMDFCSLKKYYLNIHLLLYSQLL